MVPVPDQVVVVRNNRKMAIGPLIQYSFVFQVGHLIPTQIKFKTVFMGRLKRPTGSILPSCFMVLFKCPSE